MTNSKHGTKRFFQWTILALVIIGLDQATKWAVVEWIPLYDRVPVNSFFNLTHQRNYGAAFSFLADAGGWQRWFFIVLASAVSLYLAIWMWRERASAPTVLIAGLALILGGAVGNLVDRVLLGYVTDFIQVWFGSWAFPSFNVADSAITVGAVFLIVDALFLQPKKKPTDAPASESQSD